MKEWGEKIGTSRGSSVPVKEVSRLVAFRSVGALSLCVLIHTGLNTPPLLRGFGGAAQDWRETGRARSDEERGTMGRLCFARFLSIGATIY